MKIYVAHSTGFEFAAELYSPLKRLLSDAHELVLPHEMDHEGIKSKDVIPTCDIVLAEVSYPSTGEGIELGWADTNEIPIICLYKKGSTISSALRFLADTFIEYSSEKDMLEKLQPAIR